MLIFEQIKLDLSKNKLVFLLDIEENEVMLIDRIEDEEIICHDDWSTICVPLCRLEGEYRILYEEDLFE